MAHSQSSPRGLWAKDRIDIGANQLTADSTALLLSAGIQISGARYITADSTGFVLTSEAALPGDVDGGVQFTMISNSTGVAMAINSTGTTWKYLNVTDAQPT
jgi:hypothetical protein